MSDTATETALAHWGPRLIQNGVDYNDLMATAAEWGFSLAVVTAVRAAATSAGTASSARLGALRGWPDLLTGAPLSCRWSSGR